MAVTDNPATAGDAPAASPIEQHASPEVARVSSTGLGRANAGLALGFIAIGVGTAMFVVNVILVT